MNKILDFRPPMRIVQKPSDCSLVQEQKSATVHKLTMPGPIFHIYEERLTGRDITVMEFFQILLESGMVTIVNIEEEIDIKSILRVEKGPNDIYEMGVNDFIRLTEPVPGMVDKEDVDVYLLRMLDSIGLQIGMIAGEENVFTESVLSEEEAELFHVDTIMAVSGLEEFYSCSIDNLDGESISSTADNFILPMEITLLHLLCHAYEEYFGGGCIIDEEQIHMELASNEGIYTHTEIISISLLRKIILAGIERKYPIYHLNYPSDKCVKEFYNNIVYPLLSEEYLNGGFEE